MVYFSPNILSLPPPLSSLNQVLLCHCPFMAYLILIPLLNPQPPANCFLKQLSHLLSLLLSLEYILPSTPLFIYRVSQNSFTVIKLPLKRM